MAKVTRPPWVCACGSTTMRNDGSGLHCTDCGSTDVWSGDLIAAPLKTIRVSGAPNPDKTICGKRPSIAQGEFNPMVPCRLKPRHRGPHAWKEIPR